MRLYDKTVEDISVLILLWQNVTLPELLDDQKVKLKN